MNILYSVQPITYNLFALYIFDADMGDKVAFSDPPELVQSYLQYWCRSYRNGGLSIAFILLAPIAIYCLKQSHYLTSSRLSSFTCTTLLARLVIPDRINLKLLNIISLRTSLSFLCSRYAELLSPLFVFVLLLQQIATAIHHLWRSKTAMSRGSLSRYPS